MMRGRLLIGLLVVLLGVLFFKLATMRPEGLEMSSPAPELTFPAREGKAAFNLSDLRGKVVVLDFWATWCGPCRESIPELSRLYSQRQNEGLQVLGISVDDANTRDQVPAAQKALGMSYPTYFATDFPGVADNYKFEGIPALFLIDRKGAIRFHSDGFDPRIPNMVTALLQEK